MNVFRQRGVVGLAIRRVRSEIPTFEELRLPPVMSDAGGLAARTRADHRSDRDGEDHDDRVDDRPHQRTRRAHIVTIEDPIEVVHDDALSIMQQREVGIDTDSYANALRHVIRQDPDVIFIGEIRDPESALSAIQAAETGHLVHLDAAHDRLRGDDQPAARPVPAAQQREVRSSFAGSLRGIVAQRLVQRADGKGRVPAVEVLVNTGRVFDRIVDPDETDSIPR